MLQHESFSYFLHETNPDNGLVIDKTAADWPASIAATGFALAAYPVAVERGLMPRAAAIERTLTTLHFFWNSPQGPEPDATGYQGFYYHFLDMRTGRRVGQVSGSTSHISLILLPKNASVTPDQAFLDLFLNATNPASPEPRRSMVESSGTGAAPPPKPWLPKSERPLPKFSAVLLLEIRLSTNVTAPVNAKALPHTISALGSRVTLA